MARLRRPTAPQLEMPASIADGPTHPDWANTGRPERDWRIAATHWSLSVLGNHNGWWSHLAPEVREPLMARSRHKIERHGDRDD